MQISARKICCWGCSIPIHMHTDYRGPVGEKGWRGHSLKRRVPLSAWAGHSLKGRVPWPFPWQAFIVFPGPLDQRRSSFTMQRFVLGGYLCRHRRGCSWIHQKRIFAMQREKWSQGLGSKPGRSSPDFRKIKTLSKHLLASGYFFSKSKSHSSQGTMQAWFPTGELIHGRGSCLPASLSTGFSEWGLIHISHAWHGSPHLTFEKNWWIEGLESLGSLQYHVSCK